MSTVEQTQLSVPDISCQHCVNAINGALGTLSGIKEVHTDIPTKTVQLRYDSSLISLDKVEAALDDIGYTVAK